MFWTGAELCALGFDLENWTKHNTIFTKIEVNPFHILKVKIILQILLGGRETVAAKYGDYILIKSTMQNK